MRTLLPAVCLAAVGSLAVLACFGQAASAAQDKQDKTVEETFKEAEKAMRQKDFKKAAELLTKVIEQKPDLQEAFVMRGLARGESGDLQGSLADLDQAIKLKPTGPAHLVRGRCYISLDRPADAVADFDKTLELEPKLVEAHHHRGRERFKLGKIEQSIADFDRFIELNPAHENQCWERGLSRYYAGQFDKARKSFDDYNRVGADDTENDIWRLLSQAQVESLPAAQKTLAEFHPKRGAPFPMLYDLYIGKIPPREVEQSLEKIPADARDQRFFTHFYVGMWFVVNKDRPKAIEQLEKAVALKSPDYMWYVARLQLERLKPKP